MTTRIGTILLFVTALGLVLLPAPAPATDGSIVAVYDMEDSGSGLKRQVLDNLVEYLAARLTEEGYKVVPREQVKERILEMKSTSHKSCYDQACQIELGRELAAQKTLATKILRIGSTCQVAAVMYDLKKATTDQAATAEATCEVNDLLRAVKAIALKLSGKKSTATTVAPPVRKPEPKPEPVKKPPPEVAKAEPKPEPEPEIVEAKTATKRFPPGTDYGISFLLGLGGAWTFESEGTEMDVDIATTPAVSFWFDSYINDYFRMGMENRILFQKPDDCDSCDFVYRFDFCASAALTYQFIPNLTTFVRLAPGFTLQIPEEGSDVFYGFNIGAFGGARYQFFPSFGILFELGYLYAWTTGETESDFGTYDLTSSGGQFHLNFGIFF